MADALSRRSCLLSEMQVSVQGFESFVELYVEDRTFAPLIADPLIAEKSG